MEKITNETPTPKDEGSWSFILRGWHLWLENGYVHAQKGSKDTIHSAAYTTYDVGWEISDEWTNGKPDPRIFRAAEGLVAAKQRGRGSM